MPNLGKDFTFYLIYMKCVRLSNLEDINLKANVSF